MVRAACTQFSGPDCSLAPSAICNSGTSRFGSTSLIRSQTSSSPISCALRIDDEYLLEPQFTLPRDFGDCRICLCYGNRGPSFPLVLSRACCLSRLGPAIPRKRSSRWGTSMFRTISAYRSFGLKQLIVLLPSEIPASTLRPACSLHPSCSTDDGSFLSLRMRRRDRMHLTLTPQRNVSSTARCAVAPELRVARLWRWQDVSTEREAFSAMFAVRRGAVLLTDDRAQIGSRAALRK